MARFYFAQLLSLLAYLHKQGLCVRDLSSTALRLDAQGNLKLSQLTHAGHLAKHGDALMHTKIPTADLMPPEAFFASSHTTGVAYSGVDADLFAACSLLFWMVVGTHPFKMSRASGSYTYFLKDKQEEFWKMVETQNPKVALRSDLKTMLNTMFDKDPVKRFSFSDLLAAPWLQGPKAEPDMIVKNFEERRGLIAKFQAEDASKRKALFRARVVGAGGGAGGVFKK